MKLSDCSEYSPEMQLDGARFLCELCTDAVVFGYYDRLGISLKNEKGPYYLLDLYKLYVKENGGKIGPSHILQVGAYYDRRYHHVVHALQVLLKKIAMRDPYTAQWMERGLFERLTLLFQYMERRYIKQKNIT